MNALHYGLTPKMKPISPRRSALVAALDIGSSKIVCLIARLRPHPPQQVLTRRSHAVEVVGFGHTAARGMKAGGVVNLAQAEEAIRMAVDGAEQMASVEIESVVLSDLGGPHRQRTVCRRHRYRRLDRFRRRYRARARRRQPPFAARRPRGAALAAGRLFHRWLQRHPRSARHGGTPVRRRHARRHDRRCGGAQSDAWRWNVAIWPSRPWSRAPMWPALPCLADDEADLGAAVIDMGAGATTIAVFLGRPAGSSGRLCAGRPPRDHRHRARFERPRFRCRADQDALWQRA